MRRIAAAVLTLVALVAGSCGGDDDPAGERADTLVPQTTRPEGTAPAGDDAGDDDDIRAKLLTASDLPTGYVQQPAADDADDDESEFCPALDDLGETDEPTEEAEVAFAKEEAGAFGFTTIVHNLGRFESEEAADAAFDEFSLGMQTCQTFDTSDDEGTFKGSFAPLSFPNLGDETFAIHMVGDAESQGITIDLAGDFVVVRQGRTIMLLFTIGFGRGIVPTAELEPIVRKAADKL